MAPTTSGFPSSVIRESVSPSTGLLPVFTLVLWVGALAVGIFGFVLPYARPHAPKPADTVTAKVINVELTQEVTPPDAKLAGEASPTPPDAMVQPDIPPPVAVAQPSTAIAFALPIEGLVHPADARNARRAPSAPAPIRLTFGQGEGRQPAPEYPLRARREGQEGTVGVRFTVDASGNVIAAQTSLPSPWPLLNASTVRCIRERWHLPPGVYEVSIRFELSR